MLDNNHNHKAQSECEFAEQQLVAVLYGDADADAERAFNAHLPKCAACREEFAAFGMIRNGIADWRAADFTPLESPAIVLPQTEKTIRANVKEASRLQILRDFLSPASFGWRGAAAFATLAVCAGLLFVFGYAVLNRTSDDNAATVADSQTTVSQITAPNESKNPIAIPVQTPTPQPAATVAEQSKQNVKPAVQRAEPRRERRNQKPARAENSRTANKAQPADNLEFLQDESEDDSPRLLSLFDEIEPIE